MSLDTAPRTRSETVFIRFQEAAIESNANGRPFLSLCSLVDQRIAGRITKDDLIHVAKMMDYSMNNSDVEAIMDLLPHGAVILNSDGNHSIDYRALHNLIQYYTPRQAYPPLVTYGLEPRLRYSHSGALPTYATPRETTNLTRPLDYSYLPEREWRGRNFEVNKSIPTPIGVNITTPLDDVRMSGGLVHTDTKGLDRIIRHLLERIRVIILEIRRQRGNHFSLKRQFEVNDGDNSGVVSLRTFHSFLDSIGISLTNTDLRAISNYFGRPEDDKIYYDSFCRSLDNVKSGDYRDQPLTIDTGEANNYSSRKYLYKSSSQPYVGRPNESFNNNNNASYLNPKVLRRLRELRRDGMDPRGVFESQDFDRSGMVIT